MNTYGIFFRVQGPFLPNSRHDYRSLSRWVLVGNRRRAVKMARQVYGLVGVHHNQRKGDVWDAPTFQSTMDVVADYRPLQSCCQTAVKLGGHKCPICYRSKATSPEWK